MEPFLQKLDEMLGLEGESDANKEAILTGLTQAIIDRVLMDLIESVDASDTETVTSLVAAKDIDGIFALIEGKYPELLTKFDQTVAQVVKEFKEE